MRKKVPDDAVLSETLADLRRLRGSSLDGLKIARVVVGVYFSGVKLSDGSGGMAGTPHQSCPHSLSDRRKPPPGALKGLSVRKFLEPLPTDPYLRSLTVAVLGALSTPWLGAKRYRAVYDRNALDLVELKPGMEVVLVGAFHSYIDRLKAVKGLRVKVLELRKSAMREEDMPYYVPARRADKVVPRADALIITGHTVMNGTLSGLLSLARPDVFSVVVGPSASILPDALFRRRVRMASGCVLTDPDAALDLLSQGASARHLYGACARKINLSSR